MGPVLVAAQVAITLAVVVNVAYIVKLRVDNISQPTGADVDNLFWVSMQAYVPDYNAAVAAPADVTWLQSLPGVVAAANSNLMPQGFGTTVLPRSPTDPSLLDKEGGRGAGVTPAIVYLGTAQLVADTGRQADPGPRLRSRGGAAARGAECRRATLAATGAGGRHHEESRRQALAERRCAGQDPLRRPREQARNRAWASSSSCSTSP